MISFLAPEVRLFSPVAFKPFAGREAVAELFWNLIEVFDEFEYVDELAGAHSHALVFRAKVGGKQIEGLDHLRFNENGLVDEFTVMLRPLSALMAMREVLAPRVGHLPKGDAARSV